MGFRDVVDIPQTAFPDLLARIESSQPVGARGIMRGKVIGQECDGIALDKGASAVRSRKVVDVHPENGHTADRLGNTLFAIIFCGAKRRTVSNCGRSRRARSPSGKVDLVADQEGFPHMQPKNRAPMIA